MRDETPENWVTAIPEKAGLLPSRGKGQSKPCRVWDLSIMKFDSCKSMGSVPAEYELSAAYMSKSLNKGTCIKGKYAITPLGQRPSKQAMDQYAKKNKQNEVVLL